MRLLVLASAVVLAGCTGAGAPPAGGEPPAQTWASGAAASSRPGSGSAVATGVAAGNGASGASSGAGASEGPAPPPAAEPEPVADPVGQKARVVTELSGRRPRAWGQAIDGVITTFATKEPAIALTLDACGGHGGDGYDAELIDYLRREKVPATLFVTSKWIAARRQAAASLARDPLFEMENHGSAHRPCSVTGRSAYDIRGTRNVGDAVDEIQRGALAITELSGRAPRFYRPGTAYFDDVCLDVARSLGEAAAGFAVNGDGGTGFSRTQVKQALVKAKSGSIVLLHMNHPTSETAEGIMDAIPLLRARGVSLVRLRDVIPRSPVR